MEEQATVAHLVDRAMVKEELGVAAQAVGVGEGVGEAVHHAALVGRERCGMRGVDGGEVGGRKRPVASVDAHGAGVRVEGAQQAAILHAPVGMAGDGLLHQLEEDDVDGLLDAMHAVLARLVRVGGVRKQGKLAQRDAVAALQHAERVVVHARAHDLGHADLAAGGGSHPGDVVVAPLHVHVAPGHELVQDAVGTRTTVVHVTHHMKRVDRQALDEVGQRVDEVLGGAGVHHRLHDLLVVGVMGRVDAQANVQQLVDDVAVVIGQHLADVAAGVVVRERPREVDEVDEHLVVPLGQQVACLAHEVELLVGVVDEGAEVGLGALVKLVAKERPHALADDAGAVVADVREGLELAVHVAHKVLGAAGEVEDGLEVDDLGVGRARRGKLPREEAQVVQVGREVRICRCAHGHHLRMGGCTADEDSPSSLV